METVEIASGGQSDIRHHSAETPEGPLPTDSMVTVRLSNSSVGAILDTSPRDQDHESVDVQDAPLYEDTVSNVPNNNDATLLEEDKEEFPRESMTSMTSIVEDEHSTSTSGTLRSRSDSSGTLSSVGSAQVDWDELEKSEEQAPRDEGSDEVGIRRLRHSMLAYC